MNIELLDEIKRLKEEKLNDTEIANSLGMTKANMLLILRMDSVLSKKHKKDILDLENSFKSSNDALQSDYELKIKSFHDNPCKDLKIKLDGLEVENKSLKKDNDYLNSELVFLEKELKEFEQKPRDGILGFLKK